MSYVRLKGVSPLPNFAAVQYDHITNDNSSVQAPFVFTRHYLSLLMMILFDILVWPFTWGCATKVKQWWISFSSHHPLKGLPSDWVTLSLIKDLGVLNRVRMFLHINQIICLPVNVDKGSTSIHFVK